MTSTQTYSPAPPHPAPAPRQGNGFGITALVLGICAFVLGLIPFVGFGSWFLGLLAVIFGVVGLTRKFRPKGTSIAGTIVGAISVITSLVFALMYTASLAAAVSSSLESSGVSTSTSSDSSGSSKAGGAAGSSTAGGDTHTVVYKVTGTGSASASYYKMQGGKSVSKSGSVTLPYTKKLKFTSGSFDFNTFSVSAVSKSLSDSAKLKCTLTVDGKVLAEDSAEGAMASVLCAG